MKSALRSMPSKKRQAQSIGCIRNVVHLFGVGAAEEVLVQGQGVLVAAREEDQRAVEVVPIALEGEDGHGGQRGQRQLHVLVATQVGFQNGFEGSVA